MTEGDNGVAASTITNWFASVSVSYTHLKTMATIGLDQLYYAKITEDTNGDETYGTPQILAKAMTCLLYTSTAPPPRLALLRITSMTCLPSLRMQALWNLTPGTYPLLKQR